MAPNMIVAFGAQENSYFIAAGGQTFSAHLPSGMKQKLDGQINTPIIFASMSSSGQWYVSGKDRANSNTANHAYWHHGDLTVLDHWLKGNVSNRINSIGVTFGHGKAYSWFSRGANGTSGSTYHNLAKNQLAWVKKMEENHGSSFRMFLGSGETTVMVYDNGILCWHACGTKLANTLACAKDKNYKIRFLSLSPSHNDRFFIQFENGEIVWYVSVEMQKHLIDYARNKGIPRLKAETLEQL
ncbi:hypothetical protein VKT23_012884 [Stygiomarasmius scandens]|uniref:Uncharacterized protein n=1 Tax=Marasmiellus scandens TaxID=2682957 RepID=A0ABR1J4M8_9AGAR